MYSTHLNPDGRQCVGVQRSVIRIVSCWLLTRVRKSSRVRFHQHASSTHYTTFHAKQETWSTARIARSLQTFSAPTALHTGRKVLYTAFAEHAYDLHTKFENSTLTATMSCQYPITSLKRDRPMEDTTGTRNDRESTIKPMSLLERQYRRGTNQYGTDS